jgi:hypothetical protein
LNVTQKISRCIDYIFITPHINSLMLPFALLNKKCKYLSPFKVPPSVDFSLQQFCVAHRAVKLLFAISLNIHAEKFGSVWLHPTGISSPIKAELQRHIFKRTISVWPYMLQCSALHFFFPLSFFLSFVSVYLSLLPIPLFLTPASLSCITESVCNILFSCHYDSNTNSW